VHNELNKHKAIIAELKRRGWAEGASDEDIIAWVIQENAKRDTVQKLQAVEAAKDRAHKAIQDINEGKLDEATKELE